MCGDINIDLLQQDSCQMKRCMDTLIRENLLPCITLPTRITDNPTTLIVHINMCIPLKYMDNDIISGNLFVDISDHLPNFIIVKGTSKTSHTSECPKVTIFIERNISSFIYEPDNITWEHVMTCKDIDKSYHMFAAKYNQVFNTCFPLKRISIKPYKDSLNHH